MAGINEATEQARQFWASRTARQKQFLLAGAAATVLLLTVFVRLIGTPDFKPLSTGLEAADAQALATQLDAEGIAHETSADGKTVSVPDDKLAAARMATAAQSAAHGGRTGFELFDKMSWGQTEFDEKVTYQRALEGELERSIDTLSDVKSARVHLVMPTDSVFEDQQRAGKASVILKLRGNNLPKDAVLAISRLVSGAVNELKPEDVTIVDGDSDRSLGLGHPGENEGDGAESRLKASLISTLEPVAGLDKIRASVNIDYDQGSSEESQEKYDPAVTVLLKDQKSEDIAGNAVAPVGVPGTVSNVPSSKLAKPPAQDSSQSSKSETAEYGVNKLVVHTVTPAGRIRHVSAAILVDDAMVRTVQGGKVSFTKRSRSPQELSKIQEIAEAVIGFDAKRGDTISVQNMPFDANVAEAVVPAAGWAEAVRKGMTDYAAVLRPASLLLLFLLAYLFVLRPVQRQALGPKQSKLTDPAALAAGAAQDRLALAAAERGDSTDRAKQLKLETIELIKQKPVNTARAVQVWLREEAS